MSETREKAREVSQMTAERIGNPDDLLREAAI